MLLKRLALLALGVTACGGGAPASPASPSSGAVSSTPEAAPSTEPEAKPAEPERKNDAAKYLKEVERIEGDPNQRGRVAASGLSEPQFELPAPVQKTLDAISGESVDPSQAARIIVALLEEDAPSQRAFRAACGNDWAKLAPEIQTLSPPKRTEKIVALCKVETERLGDPKARDRLNFAAVMLSVTVEKLLEARGGISQAERKLAGHLAQVQRLDNKP